MRPPASKVTEVVALRVVVRVTLGVTVTVGGVPRNDCMLAVSATCPAKPCVPLICSVTDLDEPRATFSNEGLALRSKLGPRMSRKAPVEFVSVEIVLFAVASTE